MATEADKRRLGELQAASQAYQAKRKKRKRERFILMPLWWAAQAAEATGTPKSLVVAELLWASWDARSTTFALPSGRMRQLGLSRTTVWRTLQQLKLAGLITIELRGRKAPLISFPVAPWVNLKFGSHGRASKIDGWGGIDAQSVSR